MQRHGTLLVLFECPPGVGRTRALQLLAVQIATAGGDLLSACAPGAPRDELAPRVLMHDDHLGFFEAELTIENLAVLRQALHEVPWIREVRWFDSGTIRESNPDDS